MFDVDTAEDDEVEDAGGAPRSEKEELGPGVVGVLGGSADAVGGASGRDRFSYTGCFCASAAEK